MRFKVIDSNKMLLIIQNVIFDFIDKSEHGSTLVLQIWTLNIRQYQSEKEILRETRPLRSELYYLV